MSATLRLPATTVTQQPPVPRRHPPWETARAALPSRRRLVLVAAAADEARRAAGILGCSGCGRSGGGGGRGVHHGEAVADHGAGGGEVRVRVERRAGLREAVGAGVVVGERGREPRERVAAGRRPRAGQELERLVQQLRAVLPGGGRGERRRRLGGGGGRRRDGGGQRAERLAHARGGGVERGAQARLVVARHCMLRLGLGGGGREREDRGPRG